MSDEFQVELNKVKQMENEITTLLKNRNNKIEKKINIPTEDDKLKTLLNNFYSSINNLKIKFSNTIELNKQFKLLINELENSHKEFKNKIEKFVSYKSTSETIDHLNDNENKKTENINMTKEQYQTQKEMQFIKGDEIIEEISGKAKIIKNGAVMIRDELKLHDPLLDKLEKNVTKLETKIKRSENKLETYLQKSTNSCLYWTIAIQFFILILLFAL